ncbi:2-keto-3-deoxygalactonate kinase [Franzmannia pantelleriensis]|uniref:2-keto-3-deoxygalactonate kinase n=1 Tax=Franzmannia pantelleriensis TaxID=48727 RepID=A0A1G9PRG9_9GAMM|nr:2-dehydro-3-deoxygalactonokinase [Halomonas pantelleriensis]SDM00807.1 2-keto-3-deoxygalactonate kinase [Halomonas pantelleriensis]
MPITDHVGWIAVDWGSSNLRAWAVTAAGRVLAHGGSERGMLSLASSDYETALLEVVGNWLPASRRTPVLVCGMAGARQGWREAAYLPLPARLDDLARGAVCPPVNDARPAVRLLPGLCQSAAGAFDVMRGEETQLAGLVADDRRFSGLVCLPGTHAKWARLEQGAVTRFTTCLTGELYGLLARQSVLKHSIGADDLAAPGDREAFVFAVRDIHANPGRYTARLFGLRASDLLDAGLPAGDARSARLAARLSGLCVGLELAGMGDELADSGPITLVGNAALCTRYALALEALGHESQRLDGDAAVLAGLGLAYQALPAL